MAVTNQTLVDTNFKTIVKTVCDSDANAAVNILDASELSLADSNPRLSIAKIYHNITAATGGVDILWNASSNVMAINLSGNGAYGYMPGQPSLSNNAGSGINGDVLVTNASASTFTLIIEYHKVSGFTNTN